MENVSITLNPAQSAIYNCIQQVAKLHQNIIDALLKHYDEQSIDHSCSDENRNLVGFNVFQNLFKVRDGLFEILNDEINDSIYTPDETFTDAGLHDYLGLDPSTPVKNTDNPK